MGIQVVVRATCLQDIEPVLDVILDRIEVFPVEGIGFGLSIPGPVVDRHGEARIFEMLGQLEHYAFWSGAWHRPR